MLVDGLAQGGVEVVVGHGAGVQVGVEEAEAVTTGALGLVQGDVGLSQQHAGVGQRVGGDDDADAAGDGEVVAFVHEALADGPQRPTGDQTGVVVVAQAGAQQHELVAPEAGHGVAAPGDPGQAPADLDQHPVTGVVAERVVDGLEVVEVDEEQPDPAVAAVEGQPGPGTGGP